MMKGSSSPCRDVLLGICVTMSILLTLLPHNALTDASDISNAVIEEASCNQGECLRCELDSGRCTKCLHVMMTATRECRNTCPQGYTTSWADSKDYMGRICSERQMLTLVSGRDITLIAGAAVGGAICVGMVIGALLYMKQRIKPTLDDNHSLPRKRKHRMWKDKRPNTGEVNLEGSDREEFLFKLTPLRGEINNFVDILKETRDRFGVLGKPDSATDTKAKAYRAVVCDLSRVLSLMNRKDEHIKTVPQDWRRLLIWADRVLERYKRQKEAKENVTINNIEPLSSCNLYQTQRQAQKERCRLFMQCSNLAQPELLQESDTDTPSSWKSSSRSSSVISLAPIIFEDEEDDHQEKSDKMKDLNDNEFMKNMEFMENTKNDNDVFHSNELNTAKDNKNIKIKYVVPPSPPANFKVVNEELNNNILKENNNNNVIADERNIISITRLNNMINESYTSSTNITNSLRKYKNKELEFFNSLQTPIFKPVEAPNNIEAKLNKENRAMSKQNGNAENKLKVKLKPNSDKKMTSKSNKENKRTKPPLPPKPKILLKSDQQQREKFADTYTNITRKSVTYTNDPYRDDTIEQVHESSFRSVDEKKSSEILIQGLKIERKKELSLLFRRIELTTDL